MWLSEMISAPGTVPSAVRCSRMRTSTSRAPSWRRPSASAGVTRRSCARAPLRGARRPSPQSHCNDAVPSGYVTGVSQVLGPLPAHVPGDPRCDRTRWPSTCSRPRATARRSTSACARRPAGSGRHRSVTTRSRASKASSSCTSAPAQSGARRSRPSAPRPSSSACRSGAPPVYRAATPAPTRRAACRSTPRPPRRSPSGTRSRTNGSPSCGGVTKTRTRPAPSSGPSTSISRSSSAPKATGTRANYGASPGDDTIAEPYLYVGPWDATRKTGRLGRYPFGAAMTYSELRATDDHEAAARDFYMACAQALLDPGAGTPG